MNSYSRGHFYLIAHVYITIICYISLMNIPEIGMFREPNEGILLEADVSARATDGELQVVIGDNQQAVLAALLFNLCERAERLDPYIAEIIDRDGYPMTNAAHVLEPIVAGEDMHLRPFRRRFLITDRFYKGGQGYDELLGRSIEPRDDRRGFSMQLANESSDALTGYGGVTATDEEKTAIRGYTRRLFAEVLNDVDLVTDVEKFSARL